MIKRVSFWILLVLAVSIGLVFLIHWNALRQFHERTARVQPLYQRQKILDSLSLSLERYRRMSSSFRKVTPEEINETKANLKTAVSEGVAKLDQLAPNSQELVIEHQLNDQLDELLRLIAHFEPMLFTKDAYQKPEVKELHAKMLSTLDELEKSTHAQIEQLQATSSRSELESMRFLMIVGGFIFLLMLCMILKSYFAYHRPLKRLHQYASDLKDGKSVPSHPPHFSGIYAEIQGVLNQLATGVETHVRDRHKFILDIVADLKGPLTLLQAGKYLLGTSVNPGDSQQQIQAADSVARGLAIFAGSLDDLNDIVDINRLEARLEETTVDLSELLSDVCRTLTGSESARRFTLSVPPIPLWMFLDVHRISRVLIHILAKVVGTLSQGGNLTLAVSHSIQSNFRGVEILIQDSERARLGRSNVSGPEQDILKHWISENGLGMALVHKIIKAHGGAITAAGVAGTSVTIMIRLPQERVVSQGLISPPAEQSPSGLRAAIPSSPPGKGKVAL